MAILSLENTSRLFWLGRYSERVYTTLRFFAEQFDAMIDGGKNFFDCTTKEDFAKKYCFDENNPNSIYFALIKAYDNAIELREEIGSDTFSYIQMAVYEMNKAKKSAAPLLQLQKVVDNIAAFWGMADDRIDDEQIRSIIKLGKRIERVDLYARMGAKDSDIKREVARMNYRIAKKSLKFNSEHFEKLNELVKEENINRQALITEVESLIEFSSLMN